MFGIVCIGMGIDVESLKMVSIDNATDWLVCIGSAIAFRRSFVVVLLEFGVTHPTAEGSLLLDIVLHFLSTLLSG